MPVVTLLVGTVLGLLEGVWPVTAADPIAPHASIDRQISGEESHLYDLSLAKGQFAKIVVEQHGIDLELSLIGPDGTELSALDTLTSLAGDEPLFIQANTPGTYQLKVSPVSKQAIRGSYEIRFPELRLFDASRDANLIEAQRTFARGRMLEKQGTAKSYQDALEQFVKAKSLWEKAGEDWFVGVTLNELGTLHYMTGQLPVALGELEHALTVCRKLNDARGQAEALNDLGAIHTALGNSRLALSYFEQALPRIRDSGDQEGEATALGNIGDIHAYLGQMRDALNYHSQELTLRRALRDRSGEASALHNIGFVYYSMGQYQAALEQTNAAIQIARDLGVRHTLARSLILSGDISTRLGNYERALSRYTEALAISRELGDPEAESSALFGIGGNLRSTGNVAGALRNLQGALAIAKSKQLRGVEAKAAREIGSVYAEAADKKKALEYDQSALELYRASGRPDGEVQVLIQMGEVYAALGERSKALSTFDEALQLSRKAELQGLEARALVSRARLERDQGALETARADVEQGIAIIESTRADLASDELRTTFFGSSRGAYELYMDVLMRLHESRKAFDVSERARARGLLESLAEGHAGIREGADEELLARERDLETEIGARERYRLRILAGRDKAKLTAVEKELAGLLNDYQDVRARIRTNSPRYAALTQPQQLTSGDVQKTLLDPDSVLFEYALGEDRSYVWAVTQATVRAFELPRRAVIESVATETYELLRDSPKREARYQVDVALSALAKTILPPEMQSLFRKRVIVVADGALELIPFEALPFGSRSATSEPLLTRHEVVRLPSASVLGVIREQVAGRQAAPKTVAILSDPVFQAQDPRIRQSHEKLHVAKTVSDVAPIDRGYSGEQEQPPNFARLRFSRQEARSIQSLVSADQALVALDFAASRETATGPEIADYRIVHFATHSWTNSQHPELSGIVFSLFDENGKPQDGYLRLQEIYNLKLRADLVVLSACQTALGKVMRGEGLLGLTRGFMYAGAPRVVASLWDVKDEATSELMVRFYRAMLKDKMRPAAALRAAQLSMRKDDRWNSPHDWAAFVLQGEWR